MKAVWMNFHAVFSIMKITTNYKIFKLFFNVVELTLTKVFGHRRISALWFES